MASELEVEQLSTNKYLKLSDGATETGLIGPGSKVSGLTASDLSIRAKGKLEFITNDAWATPAATIDSAGLVQVGQGGASDATNPTLKVYTGTVAKKPIIELRNSAAGCQIEMPANTNQMDFKTADTTRLSISSAGLVTAANGIAFTQTGTAATGAATTSSTLDHYEEGTWTPVIRDLAGNVATSSAADGSFTRIGNRVFIGFNIQLSSIGSMTGSYVLIAGIPFNHNSGSDNGTGNIDYFNNFNTSYSGLSLDTSSTASLLWLTGTAAGGDTSQVYVPVSAISGDERIKGGAQYYI